MHPAAPLVVVPVVPRAWVVLGVPKLLQVAVPHAVELVAKAPEEHGGLVAQLADLRGERGDDLVPLLLGVHRRLCRAALRPAGALVGIGAARGVALAGSRVARARRTM